MSFLKKRLISLFLFNSIVALGFAQQKVDYPADLSKLHQNIMADILKEPISNTDLQKNLKELKSDGSWPEIDYSSQQRGSWPPADHLVNLQNMAKAWQKNGSAFYHDPKLLAQIQMALDFWLENDLQCPNWWYPQIGVPMQLAPTLILMENELSVDQMEKGIKILDRAKIGMTGQNKVWLSGNVLLKSLLLKDEETIKKASASIQEELVVGTGEGVQPDWSYHQHGPQLQFGNYGLSYVSDMIKWITILRGTPFHFEESKVAILRNYLIEGQQWVTWKNQMDISACGRQLFVDSPESKAASLASSIKKMELVDPEHAEEYSSANRFETLSGNKHFWRSDIQIQRNPAYYFSVKMCSDRVIGAESCNAENVQGYYMGDGATFLYQSGEEYRNIFPFWDWKKIPGTTTQQDNNVLPVLTAQGYRIESNFVGGVSDSGNGVAVMDYNRNGLKARKSWFMFDNLIVCLGNGITSSTGVPITTSVNQSFLHGNILVNTGEGATNTGKTEKLIDPNWILHDNTGYIFPNGGNLQLETKTVEGSWNWVAERYPKAIEKAEIFKLWFDHGTNPNNNSYCYMLVPKATKAGLETMAKNPPYQIFNESNRQEVVAKDGSIAGIIFYEAAKSNAFGGIEVDKPCAVMMKRNGKKLSLSVADPTQKLNQINVTLSGKYFVISRPSTVKSSDKSILLTISLPKGNEAGKTISLILKIL